MTENEIGAIVDDCALFLHKELCVIVSLCEK